MKQVPNTKKLTILSSSLPNSNNSLNLFCSYSLVILLTCATLFVSSCKKDNVRGKITVPFEAVFQVKSEIIEPGPPTLISATGSGEGTPIGTSSFVGHAKVDANNIFTDEGTITVANGDQIFETAKGPGPVVDPASGNLLIISNNIITGGTGKYAGATGSYTTIAHASTKTGDGVDSLKGTITY